jgi:starch-binding outer membrane protein, SusD/RagB family
MKKYIVFSLLLSLTCFSCEKFLEEEQVSNVSYEFYDTEKGIEALTLAAYEPLRFWQNQEHSLRLSMMGTDIYRFTGVASGNEFHLYTAALNSTNESPTALWDAFYKGINSCNIAINRIPKVQGLLALKTQLGKDQRKAEVHFLRAYYYFILVQGFGKIPLLLEENLAVKDDIKRASEADVYNAIIADLTFAAANLPETQKDYARPVRAAAQHLLASVYLTRGSAVTEQRGQKPSDMDSAAVYAERVIATRGALLPNFHDARRQDNDKNKEVLFAVQYTSNLLANGLGNRAHLTFVSQYDLVAGGGMLRDKANGRAFIRLSPSNYFYDLFDRKSDSRLYKAYKTVWFCNTTDVSRIQTWTAASAPTPALVGKPKFGIGDSAIVCTFDNDKSVTISDAEIAKRPYVFLPKNKWSIRMAPHYQYHLDPNRIGVNDDAGFYDFRLMWLSETYLIAAEAYGRKGDYAKAVQFINAVRRRAAYKEGERKTIHFVRTDGGNPADITKSTEAAMEITQDAVNSPTKIRDFILEERARELSGDYDRRFDLLRTETFLDRVTRYNVDAKVNVRQFHRYWPIPQTHIDRLSNPGPLSEEQNAGY